MISSLPQFLCFQLHFTTSKDSSNTHIVFCISQSTLITDKHCFSLILCTKKSAFNRLWNRWILSFFFRVPSSHCVLVPCMAISIIKIECTCECIRQIIRKFFISKCFKSFAFCLRFIWRIEEASSDIFRSRRISFGWILRSLNETGEFEWWLFMREFFWSDFYVSDEWQNCVIEYQSQIELKLSQN